MEETITKHYIKYGYSGMFCAEYQTYEINDPKRINGKNGAFGYITFDKTFITKDSEVFEGKPFNFSGWKYVGELIKKEDAQGTLRSNMYDNGWEVAVKTKRGSVYPLLDSDEIVDELI
jgi:hypothetical protein